LEKKLELTTQELTTLLTMALSKIMDWMPAEDISKAILVPDPRDPTQLCAVHNGPDGIILLLGDGYKQFIDELLCDECQSQLVPYSVVYTGMDVHTGEIDEDAPLGLYGAHSDEIDFEDEVPPIQEILPKKRTLN